MLSAFARRSPVHTLQSTARRGASQQLLVRMSSSTSNAVAIPKYSYPPNRTYSPTTGYHRMSTAVPKFIASQPKDNPFEKLPSRYQTKSRKDTDASNYMDQLPYETLGGRVPLTNSHGAVAAVGETRFAAETPAGVSQTSTTSSSVNHGFNTSSSSTTHQREDLDSFVAGRPEQKPTPKLGFSETAYQQYFLPEDRRNDVGELKKRYEMGRKLGEGKFGMVYEAYDNVTDEKVAIKVLNKSRCGPQQCMHELNMMEQIKSQVGHDRFTPIKNVFEDPENMYFVIELLKGGELFDVIEMNGHLSEEETAVVIRKLAFALEALHRHAIIHRDIKLENIVLTDTTSGSGDFNDNDSVASTDDVNEPSEFKITDFGFSKEVGSKDSFDTPAGTLGYVAPEVLKAREYGTACDVWSAGVVMYMLLTGYAPFPLHPDADNASSQKERLEYELEAIEFGRDPKHWYDQFKEEPWDSISDDAIDLLSKMLKVDPEKRITIDDVLRHPWIKKHHIGTRNEYLNFE